MLRPQRRDQRQENHGSPLHILHKQEEISLLPLLQEEQELSSNKKQRKTVSPLSCLLPQAVEIHGVLGIRDSELDFRRNQQF